MQFGEQIFFWSIRWRLQFWWRQASTSWAIRYTVGFRLTSMDHGRSTHKVCVGWTTRTSYHSPTKITFQKRTKSNRKRESNTTSGSPSFFSRRLVELVSCQYISGPYADLWLGGGQDFEKLDQNLKFPQIVKRGKRGGNLHKWALYDEKCTYTSTFLTKKLRFLGLFFCKFNLILASFC